MFGVDLCESLNAVIDTFIVGLTAHIHLEEYYYFFFFVLNATKNDKITVFVTNFLILFFVNYQRLHPRSKNPLRAANFRLYSCNAFYELEFALHPRSI